MSKPRQESQIRGTEAFDDTLSAGVGLETSPSLEFDLNALRSQIKRLFLADDAGDWFRDVDTVIGLGGAKKRGLASLATALDAVEELRLVVPTAVATTVTVPAAQNYVVLNVAGGAAPPTTAATAATTLGAVVAQITPFAAHSMAVVSSGVAVTPYNLCYVRAPGTNQIISSDGRAIMALLQSEISTDGHTFDDATQRVQLSFVRLNIAGTALEAAPVVDIQSTDIQYSFPLREKLSALSQLALLQGAVTQVGGAGGGGGPAIEYADVSARDSVTPALVYVGFSSAPDGSENPAAAEWKILRYDSSAPIYTETYASGTTAYDKIWADRELYVYS